MKRQEKIEVFQLAQKYVKSKEFNSDGYVGGLCAVLKVLEFENKISGLQAKYLKTRLPKKRNWAGYCWKDGAKAPRIKWLNEQIKKLDEK